MYSCLAMIGGFYYLFVSRIYYVQYIHTQLVSLLGVCVCTKQTLMGGCYYSSVDSYHTRRAVVYRVTSVIFHPLFP